MARGSPTILQGVGVGRWAQIKGGRGVWRAFWALVTSDKSQKLKGGWGVRQNLRPTPPPPLIGLWGFPSADDVLTVQWCMQGRGVHAVVPVQKNDGVWHRVLWSHFFFGLYIKHGVEICSGIRRDPQ